VALAPDGPGSIDVIEIDAASHGGVDDARDLRERAFFAPVASRFKVYIIDEAHMVSPQGFNALLKLVEEPPDYVKFVFATTEPEKVLGTIRSRTHHYPFRLIPPSVLRPYLEKLCQSEGVSVEPAVFPLVVRSGGGSARDSLSVLDQLIAGAGVYGVTYTRATELLGVTDVALIDEMTDALAAGDGAAAFTTIDRLVEAGHDPRRFTGDLLERLRDLIVLQRVPDAAGSGIIDAPDDQLERMTAQASRMGQATLSRMADIAHNGLTEMRGTTAPRLVLELIIARMLLPGADDSAAAVLQRLERMERRLGASSDPAGSDPVPAASAGHGVPASPRPETAERPPPGEAARPVEEARAAARSAARPAPAVVPAPPPAAAPAVASAPDPAPAVDEPAPVTAAHPGSLDAAAVRRVWDEVLTVVRRRSQRSWAVVREAMVRDVHGDEIVLVFQHAVHANMFSGQAELLGEALREVLGGTWRIRTEQGGDGPAAASPAPAAAPAPAARPVPRAEPAGSAPAQAQVHAPVAVTADDDSGWPTPATPGGGPAMTSSALTSPATATERPPSGSAPGSSAPRSGSVGPRAGGSGADKARGTGSAGPRTSGGGGSGSAGARAGGAPLSGSGASPTARVGPASPVSAPAGTATDLDEPPWDPEYDLAGAADDEVLPPGAHETSEEQAIRALTETFGAERIGEGNPRG